MPSRAGGAPHHATVGQSVRVEWLPWGSASEREQWALEHPTLAGVYFGLMFGLVMAVPIALLESVTLGLVALAAGGVPTGILFGRRMAEEAAARGTAGYQAPSLSGMFSQFSDRALIGAMLVGGGGVLVSAGRLVFGTDRLWWSVASGCVSMATAIGAGLERRRR